MDARDWSALGRPGRRPQAARARLRVAGSPGGERGQKAVDAASLVCVRGMGPQYPALKQGRLALRPGTQPLSLDVRAGSVGGSCLWTQTSVACLKAYSQRLDLRACLYRSGDCDHMSLHFVQMFSRITQFPEPLSQVSWSYMVTLRFCVRFTSCRDRMCESRAGSGKVGWGRTRLKCYSNK